MKEDLLQASLEAFSALPEFALAAPKLKVEIPPRGKGDYALTVMAFARALNLPLEEVAATITDRLSRSYWVTSAVHNGPFLNLELVPKTFFELAVRTASKGPLEAATCDKIMVEYLSPNTNKPLHLGHVRNGVLGTALSNILEAAGHDVVRTNLVNDRGVHICKSMLGYLEFFPERSPESEGKKGDHFVGDCYVAYMKARKADPTYDEDNDVPAKAMLERWEAGDKEVLELWERMNRWVYDGFAITNERYGFWFEATYLESNLYQLGKDIVMDGLERKVLTRLPDGSIVYLLPEEKFGRDQEGKIRVAGLLRAEGTSLYLTQDLGTAVKKVEDYALDRSIYVVATEQDHHFRALFEILKALDYPWANRCYHFSYGMVELPDGRMKSREGNVVDADDLLDEMTELARAEIATRRGDTLSGEEIQRRANIIALAAIRLYLLRYTPHKRVLFDPSHSLSFEGDTGPYCLYAYARTKSILQKAVREQPLLVEHATPTAFEKLGTEDERVLARSVLEFPEVVLRSAESYNPSLVANAVLALAQNFSRFYRSHPVIGDDEELSRARLALVTAVGTMLKRGLNLLGIEVLEEM
ncbi:MAG: arginine--tRNA ligase [Parcubacteria bacterium C7867-001]|nr:MAG: arginine--tRNA ligase [Parcubacteria bacterium C7867-001]